MSPLFLSICLYLFLSLLLSLCFDYLCLCFLIVSIPFLSFPSLLPAPSVSSPILWPFPVSASLYFISSFHVPPFPGPGEVKFQNEMRSERIPLPPQPCLLHFAPKMPAAAFTMDNISTAIWLLLPVLTCLFLSSRGKGWLPQGPRLLPILGNLLQLYFLDIMTSVTKVLGGGGRARGRGPMASDPLTSCLPTPKLSKD